MSARKVVVLTGGALGVGQATAERLVAAGAALAVLDINREGLDDLSARLRQSTPDAVFACFPVDITHYEAVSEAVRTIAADLGAIDVAINNAGGVISLFQAGKVASQFSAFSESDPADWRRIVELNLFGAMNLAHAVLPDMAARRAGRLIFVSSVAGLVGAPGIATYAAAKGGVVALMKSLAREVAPLGIAVNSVAPGGVATRAFPAGSAAAATRSERILMRRLGEPDEVANVISYLALEAPTYLTGEVISVSGGPA